MTTTSDRISRADIETKLRSITETVEEDTADARSLLPVIAIAAVGVVVIGAYLMGRRRGARKSAFIEIRRI